jgi:hypothetical protein
MQLPLDFKWLRCIHMSRARVSVNVDGFTKQYSIARAAKHHYMQIFGVNVGKPALILNLGTRLT